jgi:hypothetical protein
MALQLTRRRTPLFLSLTYIHTRYFQLYDGFRASVASAYAANACFSLMAIRANQAYVAPTYMHVYVCVCI